MATAEFALVAPLLFMLVMGIVEGGTAYYSWLTVQKAAQVGARFASTGRGDDDGTRLARIIAATEAGLSGLNQGTKEINVRSWPDLSAEGDGINNDPGAPCQLTEVSVTYNYKPFTPLISPILPDTIPLHGYDRKVNEPWKPCN